MKKAPLDVLKFGSVSLLLMTVLSPRGALVAQAGRAGATAHQDASNSLSVVVGRSVLLDCAQPVERVSLGLGGFAEVMAISPTEVMLNGKAPGETTLILWERGGTREFFNVKIRPSTAETSDRLESLRRELNKQLPGQDLHLSAENGAVFLSGTVSDLNTSERAEQIASVAGKVVNLLNVQVPSAQPQILLKVVFASVDRTRSRELGINLFSTGLGNVIGSITTGQFNPPLVSGNSGSSTGGVAGSTGMATLSSDLNILAYFPGLDFGATIQALEAQGLVQVLSEPNVLAENGKQGSFLAGGEYPYPVVQGGSGGTGPTITIQFKEYGIRLNFIPTIMPNGTIRLQVAPEVSSLDFTNAVEIDGYQVPAIDVRRVKTQVDLSPGQSFAIGGLLDDRENETFQKIPFLGSIPIIGKFFQSKATTKTNTELMVFVTPEIVQPIPAGTPVPSLHYPTPFLPPNSAIPMHTPDGKAAGSQVAPAPTTMPVEELIKSMKKETPLDQGSGFSASGGGAAGSTQAPQ
jgi:pilus assembly protein CpaC